MARGKKAVAIKGSIKRASGRLVHSRRWKFNLRRHLAVQENLCYANCSAMTHQIIKEECVHDSSILPELAERKEAASCPNYAAIINNSVQFVGEML